MAIDDPVNHSLKTEETAVTPAASQQLDLVYHRSPTLLAGQTGGSPDQVQVWAPDTLTLLADAGMIGLAIFFLTFLVLLSGWSVWWLMKEPSILALFGATVLAALDVQAFLTIRKLPVLRNKVYITTDASGIAIQTRKHETQAIYWKEIQSLAVGEKKITLFHPQATEIGLWGHSEETNKRLLALIASRAELVPSAKDSTMLVMSTSPHAQPTKSKGSMLWKQFTEKAKEAVIQAQNEAAHHGNLTLEPEHLLLALLAEDNIAVNCLGSLGIMPEQVSLDVRGELKAGARGCNVKKVQLGKRAKKVLDHAYAEAKEQHKESITTGSLLLGILRTREGTACNILCGLGVTIEACRHAVNLIEATASTRRERTDSHLN